MREAERLVKHELDPPKAGKTKLSADADTRHLENDLAEKLGTRVEVKADKKGKGSLTIDFMSFEHLDGILERAKLK